MLADARWRLRRGVFPWFLVAALALCPAVRQFGPLFRAHPFTYPDDVTPLSLNMSFPLLPSSICLPSTRLLVVVLSRPSEFRLRLESRRTWASEHGEATRVLFLVGLPSDEEQRTKIAEEAAKFGDVAVVEVEEDYYNLSLKTLAILVLRNRHCKKAKCVLKADSDNVLHLRNQETLCARLSENLVVGSCDVNRLVNRDASSKWFVPAFVYSPKRYPKYCSSGSYMIVGRHTIRALLDATVQSGFLESANMRRLPEDVIFTGILAEEAGIARRTVDGLSFYARPEFGCEENFLRAYSIHLNREKEPRRHFRRLLAVDGEPC